MVALCDGVVLASEPFEESFPRLVSTSHFPEPFGTFEREGAHRIWMPSAD